MAELHGPSISRYEPASKQPRLETPSTPPPAVKTLGEKQLFTILKNLFGDGLKTTDPQLLIKQSLPLLTPQQKESLFALIPHEQEYSDQTPNVNIVIEEKQKFDLIKICQNPNYRDPAYSLALPDAASVRGMSPEKVRKKLNLLTAAVSSMMARVGFHPKNESPHAVLRNPNEISELLMRYSFFPVLGSDPDTLFEMKETAEPLMRNQINEMLSCIKTLINASSQRHISVSDSCLDRYGHLLEMPEALSSAHTPEEYHKAFFDAFTTYMQLASERQTLVKNLGQYLQTQKETLTPYLDFETIQPRIETVLEGPEFGKESEWISQIQKIDDPLLPYTSLLEMTKEFLTPYLEGKITQKTEDVYRHELTRDLIPHFRQLFPKSNLSDDEIEHFLLSAYLKIASKGVDLQNLENARVFHISEAREAKKDGNVKARNLHLKKAREIDDAINSHIDSFSSALEHSLRIDFRSMNLTNTEIDWLAMEILCDPQHPLPFNWRDEVSER